MEEWNMKVRWLKNTIVFIEVVSLMSNFVVSFIS